MPARTLFVVTSIGAILATASVWAQGPSPGHQRPKTDAQPIASALSAGPRSISQDATVVVMDGDKMRTLRQGKGEYTCVPDDPATPGKDPMCLDHNGMEWLQALMEHKDAPKGKLGLVYMLQGGSGASNSDPFATSPPAGAKWVTTGPHVMMVGMAGTLGNLPKTADAPDKPFIMFAGTSYEHVMMPIR